MTYHFKVFFISRIGILAAGGIVNDMYLTQEGLLYRGYEEKECKVSARAGEVVEL